MYHGRAEQKIGLGLNRVKKYWTRGSLTEADEAALGRVGGCAWVGVRVRVRVSYGCGYGYGGVPFRQNDDELTEHGPDWTRLL